MKEFILKNKKILLIIIGLLIAVIGVSLAFIIARLSSGAIGNTSIISDTTDNLKFNVDKDISLSINRENFGIGDGNVSDTSIATTTLLANSTTNNATYTYYVYFRILNNEYDYTTTEQLPEIVLAITNPNGEEVTEVEGLDYVDAINADGTVVSGFDITNKTGLFEIALEYPIEATSSTTETIHNWTFTATFINLNSDQTANTGKELQGNIILSREEKVTLASYITNEVYTGVDGENGIYYHDGTITSLVCMYNGNQVLAFPDGSPSTSAEDCQQVFYGMGMYIDSSLTTIGVERGAVEEVTWNNGVCQTTSGIPVYNDDEITPTVQEQCSGYAAIMGDTSVIMTNVGSGTMESNGETLDAGDNSYRFSGGDYQISEAYQGTYSQIYGGVIKRYCDGVEDATFIDMCSGNLYFTLAYDSNNTQYTTVNEALEQAVSDGYLTDDNIKNYVCFGSNESPCPEENLYRVLGVYSDKIKLIKATYATSEELGTNGDYVEDSSSIVSQITSIYPYRENTDVALYYWNSANYNLAYDETRYGNIWSYSQLNTVNLNTNYLNSLGTTWQNMIEAETWYVGGVDSSTVNPTSGTFAKQFYEAELGNNKVTESPFEPYNAKIGLMYVSEYLYSANPEYWGEIDYSNMKTEAAKWFTENWLDIGLADWTVSRDSDSSYNAWGVGRGVNVIDSSVRNDYGGVRPSFYISSSALYSSGDGAIDNPYRIEI